MVAISAICEMGAKFHLSKIPNENFDQIIAHTKDIADRLLKKLTTNMSTIVNSGKI
jgi:hypothetical protein